MEDVFASRTFQGAPLALRVRGVGAWNISCQTPDSCPKNWTPNKQLTRYLGLICNHTHLRKHLHHSPYHFELHSLSQLRHASPDNKCDFYSLFWWNEVKGTIIMPEGVSLYGARLLSPLTHSYVKCVPGCTNLLACSTPAISCKMMDNLFWYYYCTLLISYSFIFIFYLCIFNSENARHDS